MTTAQRLTSPITIEQRR
jgi:hypothetical protein